MKFVKGAPVPLLKEEKLTLGLKKYISNKPSWIDCSAWPTDIVFKKTNSSPIDKGERLSGEGECLIHKKRHSDGAILVPKKMKFSIEVEDCKDEWGLPDVKLIAGVIDGVRE